MSNKRNQSHSQADGPSGLSESETNKPAQTQTVKGRRLRDEQEEFVIEAPGESGTSALAPDVLKQCFFCAVESAIEDWDDSGGDCPSCGRSATADNVPGPDDPPQELSEAKLILQSLQSRAAEESNDDYKIRVDHLPNFANDGRADTRALKKFCRYIQPVTFDYLDTLQHGCRCPTLKAGEEGTFLLEMFKVRGEGHGFKGRWTETLTKVDGGVEQRAEPSSRSETSGGPSGSPVTGLDEIKKSVDVIKEVWTIMSPAARRQSNEPPPGNLPPADPLQMVEDSFDRVDAWRKRLGLPDPRLPAPATGADRNWITDLTTLLSATGINEGIRQFSAPVGQVLGHLTAGAIAAAAQKQSEIPADATPNNGGTSEPSQPDATAAVTLPPPAMPLLNAIVVALTSGVPVDGSVEMTLQFVEAASRMPGARESVLAFIEKEILNKPPIRVALWLAQGNPAWAYIVDLQHCSAWIDAYQEMLRESLQSQLEAQAAAAGGEEANESDVGNILESVVAASEQESEPSGEGDDLGPIQ